MKLKKGDIVIVMSGKEKGKKGKITRAHPEDFQIVVEGVNIKKKHRKATKSGEKGQIIEKQNPIASGKVRFFCSTCNKGVRLGYNMEGEKKVRICKKCNSQV